MKNVSQEKIRDASGNIKTIPSLSDHIIIYGSCSMHSRSKSPKREFLLKCQNPS
jgi:hypothetical protein